MGFQSLIELCRQNVLSSYQSLRRTQQRYCISHFTSLCYNESDCTTKLVKDSECLSFPSKTKFKIYFLDEAFTDDFFHMAVSYLISVRPDPGGHDRPPLLSLLLAGDVPNRRSLPDPGDQWQHTSPAKAAPPSHVEGPVSLRRLGLATYPNPCPSSVTIPGNECIKTTPNTVPERTSSTCPPGALRH